MASPIDGVYLPIVTPFYRDRVDIDSYKALLQHYLAKGIHGVIPLATTGEGPAIDDDEVMSIVDASRLPSSAATTWKLPALNETSAVNGSFWPE